MPRKQSTPDKYRAAGYSPRRKGELRPTFRQSMKYNAAWVWVHGPCKGRPECTKAIPFYPFILRYGLDASLSVLDRVLRCAECGKPPMSMGIAPSRGKQDPHLIPLDKVPIGLRDCALIDPLHWPAPLRPVEN